MQDMLDDKFDITVGGVTRNTNRHYVSEGYFSFGKVPLIRAEDKYLEMWTDEMELQGKFEELYKKWVE